MNSSPTNKLTDLLSGEKRFCNWGAPDGVEIPDGKGGVLGDKAPILADANFALAWAKHPEKIRV